jgi:hypothetical protein
LAEKSPQRSEIQQHILELANATNPETVEQLITQVQLKYPLSKQEILRQIIELQSQGTLILKNPLALTPTTVKNYLLSNQSYWYWSITVLAIITTVIVFIIPENAYPLVYARYLLGSIFVLFLPGYTLIKALFPTKEIDQIERAALSIGMSLALVPITGLLLNYTPWGIRLTPVTLSLLALTLTLATVALLRKRQVETETP